MERFKLIYVKNIYEKLNNILYLCHKLLSVIERKKAKEIKGFKFHYI